MREKFTERGCWRKAGGRALSGPVGARSRPANGGHTKPPGLATPRPERPRNVSSRKRLAPRSPLQGLRARGTVPQEGQSGGAATAAPAGSWVLRDEGSER